MLCNQHRWFGSEWLPRQCNDYTGPVVIDSADSDPHGIFRLTELPVAGILPELANQLPPFTGVGSVW